MKYAILFLKTKVMKKINFTLSLFFLITSLSFSQITSDLLVKAVEALPEEGSVVTQSIIFKNLELINSDQLDYSPVLYKNGILFTSNRKDSEQKIWNKILKKNSANLYYAEKIKDGEYESPVPFKVNIKGKANDGAITVDKSCQLMIYTVNAGKTKSESEIAELKLYSSEFNGRRWSKGKAMPFNCEDCTTCHPSLSANSETLYFASNRPGGYGGMDIYKVEFVDEKWETPINLGPHINTEGNEVFPFINYDGTLYFSSNGKNEADDFDIYFSQLDFNDQWKEALNIGQPFNSTADDFGFYIEKEGLSGLFSSNREGGKGMDDIYFWRMDQAVQIALDPSPVKFTIIDEETGDILANAQVSLVEFNKDINVNFTESEIPTAFASRVKKAMADMLSETYVYQTDENGNFYHDLKHNYKYMLMVEKEDYDPFRKMTTYNLLSGIKNIEIALSQEQIIEPEPEFRSPINLTAVEEYDENTRRVRVISHSILDKDDPMAKIFTEKQYIVLDNIFYEFEKTALKSESITVLDNTVQMLENFPEMEINLVSHTDSRGNPEYNKSLSQQRANTAREYLISKGVAENRVVAIGIGEEELLNGCFDGIDCSEEMHSINRRTEIVITKLNPATEIYVKKE